MHEHFTSCSNFVSPYKRGNQTIWRTKTKVLNFLSTYIHCSSKLSSRAKEESKSAIWHVINTTCIGMLSSNDYLFTPQGFSNYASSDLYDNIFIAWSFKFNNDLWKVCSFILIIRYVYNRHFLIKSMHGNEPHTHTRFFKENTGILKKFFSNMLTSWIGGLQMQGIQL